ncbi:hypothetical protein CGCF415_v008275 [Colletotrichum fructicola]|uniref:Uncharacterized protein n=1 Tax=Colletotrichum fructicola (strain Nara gc5) TaxID=1213859 RepID=L2FG11_COLFN|nr:uncharacterized protein CGMCC3_g1256 [Colletotrichum fructicola]KAF4480238.1 hypothetical protein CGGC5_v010735 [Colletotrichum fructicola Nara gc5]KAE9583309.1 hypothetical protein CGMCC3_g1256 [Colletotrichum fructicola]KAF4412580.1 hypothetical protein CFRS1_v002434 [Colletotrichum fructicola]KAF4887619.1 hypothetical protein CGCFRS4_v010406 [Colletotrichum fructicola]KAF4905547.1 hypothetical protein CGCF415_v008275 [Colletotrichum fructicola]
MGNISVLSDESLGKEPIGRRRRRELLKRGSEWFVEKSRKSPGWLAENLNLKLNHHLNKRNIHKLDHKKLLVFMGSTRRAVSGSVFGVTASSGLTAACPPFGASIAVNLWQLGISSRNCHRVRREIKSRRSYDESFRKEEEEYKAKKRHHPLVDVVLGVTLKAACMSATLGIIGFDNIGDAFVAKFADKITDAASAAASAVHALPVYSHMPLHIHVPEHTNVSIPDPTSMFQDANGSGIPCPTTKLAEEPLMAHSMTTDTVDMPGDTLTKNTLTDVSATVQTTTMNEMDLDLPEAPATAYLGPGHDTDLTSPATKNSVAAGSSVSGAEKLEVGQLEVETPTSSAEQLKIDHPKLYGLDNARSNAFGPGQKIGEKISQHVVDDSVKIGMEAKWDDLQDLHDNWNLSIAKILGLVVVIALVNEVFQPIPHASSLVAEKAIDAWNGGQLSRLAGKAVDALNDGQLSYVTARLAHIVGRL